MYVVLYNIDMAVPELQLIECVLLHDTMIFLQKQIVETFLFLTARD